MKKVIVILLFVLLVAFPLFVKADEEYELNELYDGIYLNSNLMISDEEYDYEIENIIYKNDCYVVVGSVLDDNLTEDHLEDYVTYPYIAYYDKYGKVWSTVDKTAGHGVYKDAVILDNEIVAVGSFETSEDYTQMLISKFNMNGNANSRYKTSANKSTYGNNIYYENNYYYVVGLTNATDLGGECNEAYQKIYAMKLDKAFNFVSILYINNSSPSRINDVTFGSELIFIYCTLSGTGDFILGSTGTLIVSINKGMFIENYESIILLGNVKITAVEDGLAIITYSNTTDTIKINKYDRDLQLKNSVMPYSESYELISLAFNNVNYNNLLLTCTIDNHLDVYNEIKRFNKSIGLLNDVKLNVDNYEMKVNKCYYDNGYYYFFGVTNYRFGKKVMFVNVDNEECYFNGVKGTKTLSELDTSIYGKHYQTITYNYNDITIKTSKSVDVPLTSSIVNKGKYDRQVVLEFNGTGYLNNKKINSGYVVSTNGTYVLEVRGIGVTTYLVFEVTNLSIEEENYDGNLTTIIKEDVKEIISPTEDESGNNKVRESYNLKELDSITTINNTYFYIIIFVIVGTLIGFLIPLERIGKKNE